ncbi:hypothetical protein ACQVQK_28325 [Bacillus cereus]|uniref:hypothetical protein n=1 Tax=Bacillus cereus TaxID=1396 RepID=UPI003D646F84
MSDYLYHYTSLETLKLILQNKNFRLSSLSRMDDLEEGDTQDLQKLGRYIYISSWTSNSNESWSLWNYSKGMDGVRIRMKPNIFKTVNLNGDIELHGVNISLDEELEFSPKVFELMQNEDISFVPYKPELIRVTYTDLDKLLKPTVFTQCTCGNFEIQTGNLGIFKRIEWEEQKEWRYRLVSYPWNIRFQISCAQNNTNHLLVEKIKSERDLGFIDLPLKDDVFDDLEVLCGPNMSTEGREELNRILAKYASNASIKESKLKIRV